MTDTRIYGELRDAEARRVCPPQNWVSRAADALEQQAAQIAELKRWKSTHAPRIESLEYLWHAAQREAASGCEAIATLASEREANALLTSEVEALRADAERLDWLQNNLFTHHWNGVVGSGCSVQWRVAPDYRFKSRTLTDSSGIMAGDFRRAIDTARAALRQEQPT
jgi:hypothetical protein